MQLIQVTRKADPAPHSNREGLVAAGLVAGGIAGGAAILLLNRKTTTPATPSGGILTIITASLPTGPSGQPYSAQILAGGGTPPYTYIIPSGSLPPGLSMSTTGLITGRPTTPGVYNFAVQLRDSATPSQMDIQAFSILVSQGEAVDTTVLSPGSVGTPYSQLVVASGGEPPYTYQALSGLPPGLSLAPSGLISGTPTESGTFSMVVQATDSSSPAEVIIGTVVLVVTPRSVVPLTITTTSLPGGTAGTPYSFQLASAGGYGEIRWTLSSGSLPLGLTMSAAGLISGTPTGDPDDYSVGIYCCDSNSPPDCSAQINLTLAIAAQPPPPIVFAPAALPGATQGSAYSSQLAASGGTPPYTFSLSSGAFPAGVTLSPSGLISGTPTASGAFAVDVRLTDAAGATASASLTLVVSASVTPPPSATGLLTGFFVGAMTQAAEQAASPVPLQMISVYADGPDYVIYSPPTLSSGLRLCVSVGMCTPAQATTIGKALVAASQSAAVIRIGWEFNDTSFPWQESKLSSASYVSQFEAAAAAFKAVSPNFVICWCPNDTSSIPTAWYPSPASVDWIGMDIYDFGGYQNSMATLIAFGKAQGKPVFLGEWGLNGSDDTTFMSYMCDAITDTANNFAGHVYFSFAGGINSLLSTFPNSQAIFKKAFASSSGGGGGGATAASGGPGSPAASMQPITDGRGNFAMLDAQGQAHTVTDPLRARSMGLLDGIRTLSPPHFAMYPRGAALG